MYFLKYKKSKKQKRHGLNKKWQMKEEKNSYIAFLIVFILFYCFYFLFSSQYFFLDIYF